MKTANAQSTLDLRARLRLLMCTGLPWIAQTAFGGEAICPGGSSPRSDIIWCSEFEALQNCSTGFEDACWRDNGYLGKPPSLYRIRAGDAAAGIGAAETTLPAGGNGAGWAEVALPRTSTAANYRFYVKFHNGFLHPFNDSGNHGPSIEYSAPGCGGRVSLDFSERGGYFGAQGNCGPAGVALKVPSNVDLLDDRWHMIEIHAALDTQCSNPADPFGCNGRLIVWINEQKAIDISNFNFTGGAGGAFWGVWTVRSMFGPGGGPWGQKQIFDNFAVSASGSYIGRASNENPQGAGEPASPYVGYLVYDGFIGEAMDGTCNYGDAYGYLGYGKGAAQWRDGGTLQSAIVHGLYTGPCVQGRGDVTPRADTAMRVTAGSGEGGGLTFEHPDSRQRAAIHGWIYLDPSSDLSGLPALSGFAKYGADGSYWSKYVSMSVINGQWSVIQRPDGGSPQVVVAGANASTGAWHEFEIMIDKSSRVSFMVDGTIIADDRALPTPVDWYWDYWQSEGGSPNAVIGVIHRNNGGSLTVYYDDADIGSVSFYSCKGWGSYCPYSTDARPDTTPPSAPSGLSVR